MASNPIPLVRILFLLTASLAFAEDEWMQFVAPCKFPAIFAFGDSNTDTGGIYAAFYPPTYPYGQSFFRRPAGRASDGRLIIDFIADHLGLPYLSSYLDSLGSGYKHGANFATGGATVARPTESWFEHGVSPFSLEVQVQHFNQFKNRTAYYAASETGICKSRLTKEKYFSEALFVLDIGQNDLAAGMRKLSLQLQHDAIPSIISQFISQMKSLYAIGARFFWVHNTGPIGCLPVSMAKVHDAEPGYVDEYGCVKTENELAMEFNKQLKDEIDKLRPNLSDASIVYVDMHRAKFGLISNARDSGFDDPSTICCGYHGAGYDVWCGSRATVNGSEVFADSCTDPSGVISWDGVHYTEAANKWIADQIAGGSFSDPPVAIEKACLPTPAKLHR